MGAGAGNRRVWMTGPYHSQRFRARPLRTTIRLDNPENRTQRARSIGPAFPAVASIALRPGESARNGAAGAHRCLGGGRVFPLPLLQTPPPSWGRAGVGGRRVTVSPGDPGLGEPVPAHRPAAAPCPALRTARRSGRRQCETSPRRRPDNHREPEPAATRLAPRGEPALPAAAVVPESSSTRPAGSEPSFPDR